MTAHSNKREKNCSECHKPLQYCECYFKAQFKPEDFIVDFSKIKIQVVSIDANVAPMTEFEYFQQIGDE